MQKKAGLHFHTVRKIRQEWRGKAGHVPASMRTVGTRQEFQQMSQLCRKKLRGMAAMQMLHCTIFTFFLYSVPWRIN